MVWRVDWLVIRMKPTGWVVTKLIRWEWGELLALVWESLLLGES